MLLMMDWAHAIGKMGSVSGEESGRAGQGLNRFWSQQWDQLSAAADLGRWALILFRMWVVGYSPKNATVFYAVLQRQSRLQKSAANWASLVHLFWLRHYALEKVPRKKEARALSAGMLPTDFRVWPELPAPVFALAGRVRDFFRKPKGKKTGLVGRVHGFKYFGRPRLKFILDLGSTGD